MCYRRRSYIEKILIIPIGSYIKVGMKVSYWRRKRNSLCPGIADQYQCEVEKCGFGF